MSEPHTSRRWVLLTTAFAFSGCMALPYLIPSFLEFGANLLTTAFNNYGDTHEQNMQNLLTSLRRPINPAMPQGITANPYEGTVYGETGDDPQTVYPNQEYQTAQGYPSSQDYGQGAYDLYQDQQQPYGGSSPYGIDQYSNQKQPPYPSSPYPPQQQPSAPGYSPYSQNQYPRQSQPANVYPNTSQTNSGHNSSLDQVPYRNQPRYPGQVHPYPVPSPPDQQMQTHSVPYDNPGRAIIPADPAQPENGQPTPMPISLEVLLVKKHTVNGVPSYLPIRDGDILLDGRGDSKTGDKFRVMFRPNSTCYVYIIAVDGSAWAQGIFPTASSPFSNPVKAGNQYVLPEGTNWFSLDQYKGIETIFFVASHARRQDIEEVLATITGRERNPAEKPQSVSEPAIIPNGYSEARQGLSPFAFPVTKNQRQKLLPTTYFVKTAGEDLRITRWFRHQ